MATCGLRRTLVDSETWVGGLCLASSPNLPHFALAVFFPHSAATQITKTISFPASVNLSFSPVQLRSKLAS